MLRRLLGQSNPSNLNLKPARRTSLPFPNGGSSQYRSASETRMIKARAEEHRLRLIHRQDLKWHNQTQIIAQCDQDDIHRERIVVERHKHGGRISSAQWREQGEAQEGEINQARRDLMTSQSASSCSQARDGVNHSEPARAGDDSRPSKQLRESDLAAKIRSQNAFIELLLDRIEKPEIRSSRQQTNFRRLLVDEYEARDPDGGDGLWCPVVKDFIIPSVVKAAHIVPNKLGQKRMDTIFGPDSSHELFSARNGLLLHTSIEEKFDRHLLVIVPDAPIPADGPILRWRLRILDQTVLDQTVPLKLGAKGPGPSPIIYRDLDGELLEFRSATRPAARYLYFHYVVALLRARRHN